MATWVPKTRVANIWFSVAGGVPLLVAFVLSWFAEPIRRAGMDFGALAVSLLTGEPAMLVSYRAAFWARSAIIFGVFSVPWMVYLIRLNIRRERHAKGRCIACGYDLAQTEGGLDARCPECGTVPREAMRTL